MQVVEDYAEYYLTEDGMYFKMFGGLRASSLLPKYATDYIIHKEALRQVFIDGIGSFLFEHKKTAYPPLPLKLGSYRFTKVKQADEFIEELENFHFGRMPFHGNDSKSNVAEHCKENKVHEYTHHFDKEESVFRNAPNMTALRRRFKKKITTKGGKGDEQAKAEEEAKRRNEEAQRLAQ